MYQTTLGIVLKKAQIREADKLLTLYTLEFGKLKAIAPGACKISARLLSATEPISESEFMLYINPKRLNQPKIVGAELKNTFIGLKNDLQKFTFACRIAEIINMLTAEYDKSKKIYQLIKRVIELIDVVSISKTPSPLNKIYLAFLLRFLKLSGYEVSYSTAGLNTEQLEMLNKLSRLSGEDVIKLNLSETTEYSLGIFLDRYLSKYLPYELKTRLWENY
ncbi:MAG: DNA repair protein RecO [Elusimicrobiota bacterium]|nr:DNA repair protein RecO [Elusimicrobiota bacterium]